VRHLVLEGSAQDRGQLHGSTWANEIQNFAKLRKGLLKKSLDSWSFDQINKLAQAHLNVLKRDNELWQEFTGISEGSGVDLVDLMILNNHTDLRDFHASPPDETFLECSCFAFKKGKQLVIGQTWDMHATARDFVAHTTLVKGKGKQEIFTLTGCLGLTGVSSSPFGVFINNLRSHNVKIGLAWPALVRKLLDAKTIAGAHEILKANMPSAGRNFLLADNANAANFEVTANETAQVGDLSKGILFHTNHYLSDLKKSEDPIARSKTTFDRYDYLAKRLPEIYAGDISVKAIGENFLNKAVGIISIPASKDHQNGTATCGGLLYDFSSSEGISFEGLYSENNHLKI
jgi:isopenicillin-N N-acyltransferase-like protein